MLVFIFLTLGYPPSCQALQHYGLNIHTHNRFWDADWPAVLNKELDTVAASGATMVRVVLEWRWIEHDRKGVSGESAQWMLTRYDELFAAVQARRLSALLVVWSTPCWATTSSCASNPNDANKYPPHNGADFGDFLAFCYHRWASVLSGIEMWNEPNLHPFWLSSATSFAKMIRSTYTQAKKQGVRVPLILGGLADPDVPFLKKLYAAGIQGHYNALAVHPYGRGRNPHFRYSASALHAHPSDIYHTFLQGLTAIRSAQKLHHDSTPLWLTELGWSTGKGREDVSETTQGAYYKAAMSILSTAPFRTYVQVALFYMLADDSANAADHLDNYGIVHFKSYAPKKSWPAIVSAFHAHNGGLARAEITNSTASSSSSSSTFVHIVVAVVVVVAVVAAALLVAVLVVIYRRQQLHQPNPPAYQVMHQ